MQREPQWKRAARYEREEPAVGPHVRRLPRRSPRPRGPEVTP